MNKRNTIQRSLVLETVKELRCHATSEEIYDTIGKKHPNISRATVYRNLKILSDIGEIRKMEMPSGADRFDNLCHKHYHARCLKCGRVFHVEMEFLADFEKKIKYNHGFEIIGYDVLFKGTCPECNQ